jgi:deoxyribodipyrimidine photo-lyase
MRGSSCSTREPAAVRTIVWYRFGDLRVADHQPLRDAARAGEAIPLFLVDPATLGRAGARARPHATAFGLDALSELAEALAARGSALMLAAGEPASLIPQLAARWQVDRVVAHRLVAPAERATEDALAAALGDSLRLYDGQTLAPPGTLRTGAGKPYAVFTPFARAFRRQLAVARPLAAPRSLPPVPDDLPGASEALPTREKLDLPAKPNLLRGGERAARMRLRAFLEGPGHAYHELRDRLDLAATSRLSADLTFGTLSARAVWHAAQKALGESDAGLSFSTELLWREFAHSTLWDRPELLEEPYQLGFAGFPWREDRRGWEAWERGETGYPVVDAAARQLLSEGFVHNRARMISASFLTKDLLIHYQQGEAHYLRYLADGDPAQNNMGWQWVAGCGCDAQPYFRIFNPTAQGQRFDPTGGYVRRWLPELARLSDRFIHEPWKAPGEELRGAGIRLDATYPRPIVSHREARERFLAVASEHLGPRRRSRR